jgi:hypothetical protein
MLVLVSAIGDKVTEGTAEDASAFTLPQMALQTVTKAESLVTLVALIVAPKIHPPAPD